MQLMALAGDNELGDIPMVAVPPILTGHLVGEPDPETRLVCEAVDEAGEFRALQTVWVRIAADGSFTARGEGPPASLRLVVSPSRHLPVSPLPWRIAVDRIGPVLLTLRDGEIVCVGSRRSRQGHYFTQ